MDLDEYIAWLEKSIDKIDYGAAAAANAMAEYLADRIAYDTLQRQRHAPGAYFKAAPGAPPASASGNLARSTYWTPSPASRGLRASAYVGNSAKYANLLEFGGCVLRPTSGKVMHWSDSGGSWYHARLPASGNFPAHPFIQPTIAEAIADGSLRRVFIDAFMPYDP
jgi:hypothetical protein